MYAHLYHDDHESNSEWVAVKILFVYSVNTRPESYAEFMCSSRIDEIPDTINDSAASWSIPQALLFSSHES